ncbi:MAG: asparagine synthase (glutamine-hydrolyzing) [Phycisphaerales bacterium]|nr:asparagine synthase (glutamine-hydrolyzing) [Phycisphaerales bacterium]
MCGLAAILCPTPRSDAGAIVARMLDRIAHRGPDDRQCRAFRDDRPVPLDEPATVVLGHLRLAIQDLSDAGRQPMADPDRRRHLIFNGEIYNFIELAGPLRARSIPLVSAGDTEVLLHHLIARPDEDLAPRLADLDGMFAFMLLDLHARRLTAVRDRFGIKPLYLWTAPDGAVLLASEIKAFTAHPHWTARLNHARAHDYLARGIIDHTAETLFADVRQLAPGHQLVIDLRHPAAPVSSVPWYDLDAASASPSEDAAETCRALVRHAVRMRLRADVPIGSCLSGGVDSSAIVCMASLLLHDGGDHPPQLTFTASDPDDPRDEWPAANLTAQIAGADAVRVHTQGATILDRLDDLVWTQDEPFGSTSIVAQHAVFEAAAARGLKVMLDGQGADEIFGGYHVFFRVLLWSDLRRGRLGAFRRHLRAIRAAHGGRAASWIARALASGVPGAAPPASLARDVFDLHDMTVDPFRRLSGRTRGIRAFSIDQVRAASLPMLLHWEDRNSMAHSIEARVPFLSHPLVEFALGLPDDAKVDPPVTKRLLRDAMRGIVPNEILDRRDKIAFSTPERRWLIESDPSAASRALADAIDVAGPLIRDAAPLHAMIADERDYDPVFWRTLCFAAWLRRFDVRM